MSSVKAKLSGMRNRIWDEQNHNQVGTDKDYLLLYPDIEPEYSADCDDDNAVFVSWTGDNANTGTEASPKRSLDDDGYNSSGTGALSAAIGASKDICFVSGSTEMWVEPVSIPYRINVYKAGSGDTPILRTCKRVLPANPVGGHGAGQFTDFTTAFVDPNRGSTNETKLLIHSNTTDGSTSFVDYSENAKAITPSGSVHHETDQKKFGASSIEFIRASSDYLSVPNSADWDFGSGDFTIDFWLRLKSVTASYVGVMDCRSGSVYKRWVVGINTNGGANQWPFFRATTDGASWTVNIISYVDLALNTWYHIAIVRSGNTWTMYKDGVSIATATVSGTITADSAPLLIGYGNGYANLDGYIDEIRIIKGVAHWTAAFGSNLPSDYWTPYTQRTPAYLISKVIEYFDKGFSKYSIMIFNSGLSGTPGDCESLVIEEDYGVDVNNTVGILCGIQYAYDWFTTGDTPKVISNANSLAVSGNATSYGMAVGGATNNYFAVNEYTRYLKYTTNGKTFITSDVTGASENLYDLIYWNDYFYCGCPARIRRATTAFSWADATTSTGGEYFCVRGSYLYAFDGSNIYRTSNGTTWNSVSGTFPLTTSYLCRPAVFNDNIYLSLYQGFYRINIDNELELIELPKGGYVAGLETYDGKFYILVAIIADGFYFYEYNGTTFTLIEYFETSHTSYDLLEGTLYSTNSMLVLHMSYFDKIYYYVNDTLHLAGTSVSDVFHITQFNRYLFLTKRSNTTNYLKKILLGVINYCNGNLEGIEIDGQNKVEAGNYSKETLTYNQLKYCHIYDCINYATKDHGNRIANYNEVSNNIIHDCTNGMSFRTEANGTTNIYQNLIYNIKQIAIQLDEPEFYDYLADCYDIKHNTIDSARIGIHYNMDSIEDVLIIKNNIFSRVVNYLTMNNSSISNQFLNNLIAENSVGINITPGTTNKSGSADFRNRDKLNQDYPDYRLKVYGVLASNGQPYSFNSPGVRLADDTGTPIGYSGTINYDAGCYLFTRNLADDLFGLSFIFDKYISDASLLLSFSNIRQFLTASGIFITGYTGESNRIGLTWEPETQEEADDLFNLIALLKDSINTRPARFFVNHELFDELWNEDFSNISESSNFRTARQAGDLGITSGPSSGDNVIFDTEELTLTYSNANWKYDEFKGWWVHVSFQKESSPFEFVGYWFKIVSNDTTTLTLKNKDGYDLSSSDSTYNTTDDYCGFTIMAMDVRWPVGEVPFNMSNILEKKPSGLFAVNFDLVEA